MISDDSIPKGVISHGGLKASSSTSVVLCADCDFEIKPPYGKVFVVDGEDRCASCHIEHLAMARTKPFTGGNYVYNDNRKK